MADTSVSENNGTNDRKIRNYFINFNKSVDKKLSVLELTSKLLSRSELEAVLKLLPEESYKTNTNQSIYSLKINGKPFFIDYSQYNYDIYSHQTNVGNGIYFCDKHRDLMYVLRIVFHQQTDIDQITIQELHFILKVLPSNSYQVNCNQSIYTFKLNGKPFYIDKSQYINDCNDIYSLNYRINPHLCHTLDSVNGIIEEKGLQMNLSEALGQIFAQKSRLFFIRLKSGSNDSKNRLIKELISGKNKTKVSEENSETNKWNTDLAKRKVYQKDLMIRSVSSKEAKHILNKCKESLFNWRARIERRKQLQFKAKLSSVNSCDILSPTLYAICESIEPNDVNHNINQ